MPSSVAPNLISIQKRKHTVQSGEIICQIALIKSIARRFSQKRKSSIDEDYQLYNMRSQLFLCSSSAENSPVIEFLIQLMVTFRNAVSTIFSLTIIHEWLFVRDMEKNRFN